MPRRITSLLVIAALAQMFLGGVAAGCAAHDAIAASDAGATRHAGMPMANDAADSVLPAEVQCEECTAPPDQPPCDHTSPTGTCSSMASCVTSLAMIDARLPAPLTHDSGVLAGTSLAPEHPTLSPESPPPRA